MNGKLAALEVRLAQMKRLRGLSLERASEDTGLFSHSDLEPSPEPLAVASSGRTNPSQLAQEWHSFRDERDDGMGTASRRCTQIDRSVEELESQLRWSDRHVAAMQAKLSAVQKELSAWQEHSGSPLEAAAYCCQTPPRDGAAEVTVIATLVLGWVTDPKDVCALSRVSRALLRRVDEISEQRTLRILASDKFGTVVPGRALCCAALVGDGLREQCNISKSWRMISNVLHRVWEAPSPLPADEPSIVTTVIENGSVYAQLAQHTSRFHWLREHMGRAHSSTIIARLNRATEIRTFARRFTTKYERAISQTAMQTIDELLFRAAERDTLQTLACALDSSTREQVEAWDAAGCANLCLNSLQDLYTEWCDQECLSAVDTVLSLGDASALSMETVLEYPCLASRWHSRGQEGWSAARVHSLKSSGNDLFRAGNFEEALTMYTDALIMCDGEMASAADSDTLDLLERDCLLNCAACTLRLDDPSGARRFCDAALAIDPTCAKGLYRRGQAFLGMYKAASKHSYARRALADLGKAVELAPRNSAIRHTWTQASSDVCADFGSRGVATRN
eukprot:COSAG01_NODE_6080_length_3864_cov_5.075697_3_plen_564_part_00